MQVYLSYVSKLIYFNEKCIQGYMRKESGIWQEFFRKNQQNINEIIETTNQGYLQKDLLGFAKVSFLAKIIKIE